MALLLLTLVLPAAVVTCCLEVADGVIMGEAPCGVESPLFRGGLLGSVLGEEGDGDAGWESIPRLPRSIGANAVMAVALPLPRLLP